VGKTYDQRCPIARTLDIIGDRWTILILRDIYFGFERFGELQESLSGISTRILSERLKLLEANGLIEREIYSEHPRRARYRLTLRGASLEPILSAIAEWGLRNTFAPREAAKMRASIATRLPANTTPRRSATRARAPGS
jgi:DNA-binding HxlR family transcriptional regulator